MIVILTMVVIIFPKANAPDHVILERVVMGSNAFPMLQNPIVTILQGKLVTGRALVQLALMNRVGML